MKIHEITYEQIFDDKFFENKLIKNLKRYLEKLFYSYYIKTNNFFYGIIHIINLYKF